MLLTEKYDVLARAEGTLAKVAILKELANDPLFAQMLVYTYTPTWKYYIKKMEQAGHGVETLESTFLKWTTILNRLRTRTITGESALIEVARYIATLTPRDGHIFKYILKKDLRAGIGATIINTAVPGLIPEFKFMKAKKYENGDIAKHGSLYMSLKIDCIRGLLRDGTIFSTGGKVINGVQHLAEGLPSSLQLDMELTIPGLNFQEASGKLRSSKDCPTVVGMVFDIPSENFKFSERYNILQEYFNQDSLLDRPGFKLLTHKRTVKEEVIFRNFENAISNGYEGLVLKTPNHEYQLKRSADWLKVKAEDPDDLIVVDFNEGTGKYEGTLGTLVGKRLKNNVLVKVGGMPDAMKHEVWNNKDKFLFKHFSAKYHEETPDGSLRHPRFFRWRWDLDKE